MDSSPTRRDVIKGLGSLAAGAAMTRLDPGAPFPVLPMADGSPLDFPRKADFRLTPGETFLSGAYTHPMPIAAARAAQAFTERRTTTASAGASAARDTARRAFAALINASPAEVSLVQNTSSAENLIVECLGVAKNDGNVVSDLLHFDGALIHLLELEKRGLDLRLAKPKDGRILLADFERLIDRKTRLVEVSLVSWYNGFQHDLKAVCDLAHAHGAYVYCDVIQGVGAVPFDVRASSVDFAACSSYKWLMGDFGLGFLYVREALLGTVIQRPHWSYESTSDSDIHLSPFDPQSATPIAWTPGTGAAATFELGTMASGVAAALSVSLPYIQQLGLDRIVAHRQPMMAKLQAELPRLGFTPQTPSETTGPIETFAHDKEAEINRRLDKAKITVRVAKYWMRVSPSVYNDMADIDRLLEVLS